MTFSRFPAYYVGDMKLNTLLNNSLTVRDGIVLTRLSEYGTSSAKPLTCDKITPANLSRIVAKLVDKGLITRISRTESGEKDQRRVTMTITKLGKAIVNG